MEKEPKMNYKHVHRAKFCNTIFETVLLEGHPVFLCYTKDKGFTIANEKDVGNKTVLIPIPKDRIPYRQYTLDTNTWKEIEAEKYKVSKQDLFDQIYDTVNMYLSLDEVYKTLITAQIIETYIQHKLNAVGYLFAVGQRNSGKSRACDMVAYLGYRPLYGLGINAANIYNYIGSNEEDEGQVTIVEDEIDPKNERKDTDLIERLKIYRSGYRKGNTVPRILDSSSSERIQVFFKTFCSKMFAGYEKPHDDAFNTRCIELPMVEGIPEQDEILPENMHEFDKIKLSALIWRMQTYFDSLPERELKLNGRMKEVWKCKIFAVADTTGEAIITKLAYKDLTSKFEESHNSLECKILQSVLDYCTEMEWGPIQYKWIFGRLLQYLRLTEQDYEAEAAKGPVYLSGMNTPLSHVTVGRTLLSMIHGKRILAKGLGRMYIFDKSTVQRLATSYKITPLNTATMPTQEIEPSYFEEECTANAE